MSVRKKITSLALLSSTALVAATPGLAQDAAQSTENQIKLEEIVVTATRRATMVQDIPYNISALSGSTIDDMKMVDATEMLRSIPGIVVADRGNRNAATKNDIRIRGLNVDGAARGDYAASSAPTVATYINDTPVFANMMLKDLERVEVLRGPQGTLYGSGALGGAVRYITRKPVLGEFSGTVSGTGSSTKGSGGISWTGDVVLNVPLGDKIALRAVASHLDNAGIIDYVNVYELDSSGAPVVPGDINDTDAVYKTVKDADTAEIDFLRLSAFMEVSDAIDISLMYTTQSDEAGSRRATAEGFLDGYGNEYGAYTSGSVQLEPSEADLEMFAAEINVDLGFATLTSSTSHYDVHGSAISENTGFYAQKNWLGGLYYNSPRPLARADRSFGDKAFIQEVRLVSDNEGPLNWVAGVYYQDQDKTVGQTSTLAGYKAWASQMFGWMSPGFGYDENDNDFIYTDLSKVKETAIYGEVTYDIGDSLHLTGGMRWFDSSVSSDAEVQLPFWDSLASWAPARTVTESGKKDVLFKGNISYDVQDDTMIYATISEGYRRGGAAAVPTTGNFAEDPAWLAYGSDSVVNYELGVKGSSDRLRYSASVFYVDWSNPQINTATSNWGFFTAANGDTAATKGVELEMEGQLSQALHYSFGYAYVDAKLTSDFIAPTGAVIAEDGNRLPGIPKHTLNVALDYTKDITSDIVMVTRLDGYYQSDTKNYINNTHATYGQTHSGFSIWNASLAFTKDNINVTLFAKNIFNQAGISASYSAAYMGTDPSQNYFGSGAKHEITLPRTLGLAVSVDF
ncbi:TonB-dependent receptor [Paremcibacter congregatus]|uniref:TonB-dependent receptor n=1 Tax=Paremcibacter congregatus TaxID=2043170 RepID=UPI003A920F6A